MFTLKYQYLTSYNIKLDIYYIKSMYHLYVFILNNLLISLKYFRNQFIFFYLSLGHNYRFPVGDSLRLENLQ